MAIEDVKEQVADEIECVLDVYGELVDVLKYTTSAPPPETDLYRQRVKGYAAPVSLLGHVTFDPDPETLTAIGADRKVAGTVLFSRRHLAAAFPGVPVGETIDQKDELGHNGRRWKIVSVHETGRLRDEGELLYVTFDVREGKQEEVYP